MDSIALDKPLITINFDGWEKDVPILKSIKRWRLEDNQISWMSFGATRMVGNKGQLADAINAYLDNPSLDSDARAAFRRAYCGEYDGRAAERIAAYVFDHV